MTKRKARTHTGEAIEATINNVKIVENSAGGVFLTAYNLAGELVGMYGDYQYMIHPNIPRDMISALTSCSGVTDWEGIVDDYDPTGDDVIASVTKSDGDFAITLFPRLMGWAGRSAFQNWIPADNTGQIVVISRNDFARAQAAALSRAQAKFEAAQND